MIYSIYDKMSGQILRVVKCPDTQIAAQYDLTSENCLVGEYPDDRYYVNDGAPVALPPKPSEHHVFDYTTKQWVDPRTPETEWPLVRAKRDRLLQQSDWAALPDVPLTTEKRAEWAVYRQALRDVTLQEDPFNITWPIQPS